MERQSFIAEVRSWKPFTRMTTTNPAPVPMKEWGKYFTGLLNPEGAPPIFHLSFKQTVEESHREAWYNAFMNTVIMQVIQRTKNYKATGPDNITIEHLEASIPVLLHLWTLLFNSCLFFGIIPSQWKNSIIVVLYKVKVTGMSRGNAVESHSLTPSSRCSPLFRRIMDHI